MTGPPSFHLVFFCCFRIDARDLRLSDAVHRAEINKLGHKAHFNPISGNPTLKIEDVSAEHSGAYICRVDFKESPSRYTKVNLTVIGE